MKTLIEADQAGLVVGVIDESIHTDDITSILPPETQKIDQYAYQINALWHKAVDTILEVGRTLIFASQSLSKSEYTILLAKLKFGDRTANRLIRIAADRRLLNPDIKVKLPPSWSTLYELSLYNDNELKCAIDEEVLVPEVTRGEVISYKNQKRKILGPVFKGQVDPLKIVVSSHLSDPEILIDIQFLYRITNQMSQKNSSIGVRFKEISNLGKKDFSQSATWQNTIDQFEERREIYGQLLNILRFVEEARREEDQSLPMSNTPITMLLGDGPTSLTHRIIEASLSESGIEMTMEQLLTDEDARKKLANTVGYEDAWFWSEKEF